MPSVVNTTSGTSFSSNTLTVSNTPGAGTNYLFVVVELNSGSGSDTAASYGLTYNGVSASQITASLTTISRNYPTVVLFGLRDPPSGANDAVFTVTHSGVGPAAIHMTVYNLSDVGGDSDLNGISGTAKAIFTSYGNSFDITLTTTDPDTLVLGGVGIQGGDITATEGSGYTNDDSGVTSSNVNNGISYLAQHKTAAASGNVTWDVTWSANDGATAAAVAFKGAGGGGGAQNVSVGQATETDTGQAVTASPGPVTLAVGQAVETDTGQTVTPVSGAQNVPVGQATETDTADVVTSVAGAVTLVVGQAIEVDTGQAVTPGAGAQNVSVGQAVETDTGQAVTPVPGSVTTVVGQAVETDTGQAVTPAAGAQNVAVGQAAEADTAQTVTPVSGTQNVPVGQATETDTADVVTSVAGSVTLAVGQAVETDSAQTISDGAATQVELLDAWTRISVSASTAITGETFTVSAGSNRLLIVAIGEESTTGRPFSVTYGGQAMTALPQAVGGGGFPASAQFFILTDSGIQAASDSLVRVTFTGTHNGQFRMFAASYENVSQTAPSLDTHANGTNGVDPTSAVLSTTGNGAVVGMIVNSNAGTDATWSGVNEAIEEVATSSYHSIGWAKTTGTTVTVDPTLTVENSIGFIAFSMAGLPQIVDIGQAGESDSAQTIIAQNIVNIGQAAETDSAQTITPDTGQTVPVGQAVEADTAQAIAIVNDQVISIGQAAEADSAQTVDARPSSIVAVGQAAETDTAQSIGITIDQFVSVGQAAEADTAQAIVIPEVEDLLARQRREEAGSASAKNRLRQMESFHAERMAALRATIEREDDELIEVIPAIASMLVRLGG